MAKQLVDVSTKELALDAQWHEMDDLEAWIGKIQEKISNRRKEYNRLKAHMTELENLGLIYAGTTWKNGKYLYLVYPSKDGEPRKRVYIGQEETKVKEAFDGIKRGEEYLGLKEKVKWLESQCWRATMSLRGAADELR